MSLDEVFVTFTVKKASGASSAISPRSISVLLNTSKAESRLKAGWAMLSSLSLGIILIWAPASGRKQKTAATTDNMANRRLILL